MDSIGIGWALIKRISILAFAAQGFLLQPEGQAQSPKTEGASGVSGMPVIRSATPLGVKGIFLPGEAVAMRFKIDNAPASWSGWQIKWTGNDFDGCEVFEKNFPLNPGKDGNCEFEVPGLRKLGFYSVRLELLSPKGEIAAKAVRGFCVLPLVEGRNDPFFGASGFRSPLWMRDAMRRIGIGLALVPVKWAQCEPKPGEYDWTHPKSDDAWWKEGGFKTMGFVQCSCPEYVHKWITPSWELARIEERRKANLELFPPEHYVLFRQFAKAAALELSTRFDGVWDLMNEIDIPMRTDFETPRIDYVKRVKAFHAGLEESGTRFTLKGVGVAGSDADKKPPFPAARAILSEIPGCLDVFGPHLYPSPRYFGPGKRTQMPEYIRGQLFDALATIRTYGKDSLYIDEVGYALQENLDVGDPYARDMAIATARLFLLARTVPQLQEVCVFTVMDTREGDSSYGLWSAEGGGLISNYAKLTDASSVWPRPVAAAYATVTKMISHARTVDYLPIHKELQVCVYRKDDSGVVALWTTLPDPVALRLRLESAVRQYDLMGNSIGDLAPGANEVKLTGSPVFLVTDAKDFDALLTSLRNAESDLPEISLKAGMLGLNECELRLQNMSSSQHQFEVVVSKYGKSVATRHLTMEAQEEKTLNIPLPSASLQKRNKERLSFAVSEQGKLCTSISLVPVLLPLPHLPKDGTMESLGNLPPSIELTPANNLWPIDAFPLCKGPEDASVKCWLAWDERNLYLSAKVRDDVHVQESGGPQLWMQDSLLLALIPASRSKEDVLTEMAMAFKERPEFHCYSAPSGSPMNAPAFTKPKFDVQRISADEWHYGMSVPWSWLIGKAPCAGQAFKINLVYMDADKPGEHAPYWLQLSCGTHEGPKNPELYHDFILMPEENAGVNAQVEKR